MELLQFLALLIGVPALLVGVVAGLIWLVMRWLDYPGMRLLDRWKDVPRQHARSFHIHEEDELDEGLLASWIKQASELPGWDGF